MINWIEKEGYATKLLADAMAMDCEGLQIQLVRFTSGKYSHYHKKKTEFFYFLSDGGKINIGGIGYDIKKGSAFIVKPGIEHSFSVEGEVLALNIKTNDDLDDTYTFD